MHHNPLTAPQTPCRLYFYYLYAPSKRNTGSIKTGLHYPHLRISPTLAETRTPPPHRHRRRRRRLFLLLTVEDEPWGAVGGRGAGLSKTEPLLAARLEPSETSRR